MNNRDYTNIYQGNRKYKNLRQQIKGESKLFFDKIIFIRIPLAIILILIILFMTGYVSNIFADRLNFKLAKELVLFPSWMEKYNPDLMDYYDAGIKFQDGDYVEALNDFTNISELKRAKRMISLSNVRIANDKISSNEYDSSFDTLVSIDIEPFSFNDVEEYKNVINLLIEYFTNSSVADKSNKLNKLNELLNLIG